MTRIMHVNGKFTDIYSYVKKLFILAMLMGLGATETWAQEPVEITTDANGNGTIEDAEKNLYLIQTNAFQSFYIAPQSNNTITTNNILGDYMLWYFMDAGTDNGTQYYYIVNNSTEKYIYNHNGNSRGISIISSSEFASLSDANKEKCKFKLVADNSNNTTGYYNINVKATQTYYGLNKQNGSETNQNPIRLTNTQYIHDSNSKWKFIPFNGTFTMPTPPFTVSTDGDKHFYTFRNFEMNKFYASIDETPDKVTFTNQVTERRVWYFKEASSDSWYQYYYIIHPSSGGKYMYYNGTATDGSNQTNAVSVKAYDSNYEDRYLFVVVQAARGNWDVDKNTDTRKECYAIIPKKLIDKIWGSNSLGLDKASIADGVNMGIISSRGSNNGAHWTFNSTELNTECVDPVITFSNTTGKATISTTTLWPSIYYTTDGTTVPSSTNSSTLYGGPFDLTEETTIKAIVTKNGYTDSKVITKTIYKVATPSIQANDDNAISITCATTGATIYYTTNGDEPTTSSTVYTAPLGEEFSGKTIKAIAIKDGSINSAVASETITMKCAKPTFTVTTSGENRSLTIKCTFPSTAKIYYTTNGNTPTSSSTEYTGTFSVTVANVIKAIAIADGFTSSDVATKTIREELTLTDGKYLINNQDEFETFIDMACSEEGATYHYVLNTNVTASDEIILPFSGTFDGQGHTISGLGHALFNSINGGTVKNVILDGVHITSGTNVGAIANEATGASRIYNIGILDGSVGGNDNVGGIVGLLDGSSRVINCYSYATITGGTDVGGIVGYNKGTTTAGNINTMVMNCMFYGDITGGTTVSPVYGGNIIDNLPNAENEVLNGLNTYNYYAYEKLKSAEISDDKYNCALAVEDKYLNRFEFYRQLLNSNKKLAAYYATGSVDNADQKMAKWVLETADRQIATPKPYPILKAQGKYPSIINYDAEHAPDSATVGRNKGGNLGKTLTINITGTGVTTSSLTIQRTDKDFDRYNYNYDKVQLPYYNDVGTNNYTGGKVVTGWKITGMTNGTAGEYKAKNEWNGFNFADRYCTNKDLYSVSGRVFSQGAYFDVPYGVTAITIEPYWGNAVYVADKGYDVIYDTGYGRTEVTALGTQVGDNTMFKGQKVYSSISTALSDASLNGSTVYDNAIVLVGNLHQSSTPSTGNKAFTIMSVDEDNDHEPDYSMIYHHNNRVPVCPIRFDFINIPGTAQAQKPNGATTMLNFTIYLMKGWFEITNTCIVYSNQVEYENNNQGSTTITKAENSPLILLGGDFEQFVSTRASAVSGKTNYIHVGSNVYIKNFGVGTHSDGNKATPHIPVSVTGGEFEGFYLSGTYNPNAATNANDHAECYISSGHFVEAAGACQEAIDGNVRWQIYNADIDAFYGGGINDAKPITGTITTDIFNSHVGIFCGGPKFGNMTDGKDVTTRAEGCVFEKFFGAGYGGLSYSKQKYFDESNYNFKTHSFPYTSERGKYYDGETTFANGSHEDYGKKGPGVATDFDYEFFVWSTGQTGARMYVKFASFSLAQCDDVYSTLNNCTINQNFYGGGSFGSVSGTATSVLNGCTVHGNVFGGGYSATREKVPVRNAGFDKLPAFNSASGMFEEGVFSGTTDYEWKHVNDMPENSGTGIETSNGKHYIYTDVNLDQLGKVGNTALTIQGNTVVDGKIFQYDEDGKIVTDGAGNYTVAETTGGVFGGGDMSAVNNSTQVTIENTGANGILNVFGGGNTADVVENTTVTITGGTIGNTTTASDTNGNVYGGGKGATTVVGGNVTVNLGTKTGTKPSFTYTGTGLVKHNLYGGSALGNVNTTPNASSVYDKTTTVNIYSGTVNGSVFGGGLGHDDADNAKDIIANNYGNTTVTVENSNNDNAKVLTAVYGGANENGVVKGGTTVTITGGTVGTLPTGSDPITNVVFGGGFGQPTLVEGNVMLNIGTQGQAGGGATINGHVYGGGALGSVNTSKPESVLVFDTEKKDSINLYKGTITGNVYGGGLGQKNGENGATSDIESFVGGDVTVTLDGAKLVTTFTGEKTESNDDRTFLSGQIFGANNLNGTPKGHVKVHVKRTVDSTKDDTKSRDQRTIYDVAAVYGGGNKADYIPTNATLVLDQAAPEYKVDSAKVANACAEVIIEGCEQNSIEYVYGGGNAAAVPATNVTVKGTYIINILYGGGNGKSTTGAPNNPGANVGTYNNGDGATEYGSGKAVTKLIGGYINSVYGGSNTLGDVRGGTDVRTKEKSDPTPDGIICCEELNVGKIYGAGSHADVNNDVNIILECMPEDYVDAVYGGAEEATVNGNVTLVVTSGKFGRVFGGNNKGGDIRGTITVVAKEEGCQPLEIGELYGGGNQAPYSKYGCEKDGNNWVPNTSETVGAVDHTQGATYAIDVLVESCTSIGKIFGGGNEAEVIGNTHVEINMFHGTIESAPTTLRPIGRIGQVFGGGNLAKVTGNTTIHIGTDPEAIDPETGKVPNDQKKGVNIESGTYINPLTNSTITIPEAGIYGGGNQANVEGNATLTIGTANQSEGIKIGGNIFGGGYGETTLVTGNITVNIGKRTGSEEDGYSYEGYAQITGDIYGGSAKGKVNVTKGGTQESPTYSATPEKSTQVNFYGGTLSGTDKGNLYGGGKGEDNAGTVNDHAADVFGPVTVTMGSGTVNNVFGCNNVLGSPKDTVAVFINGGTVNHSVYGGGNQAVYTAPNGNKDYPAVSIYNGTVSENVFGGGLGTPAAVTGNPQVIIGDMDNSHTATVGGSVYGGGDAGDVRGNPHVKVQNTNTTIAKNVFGAGKGVSDTFTCEKAMVGVEDEGACEDPGSNGNKDKGTKVTINNGTIGTLDGSGDLVAGTGNVYGGGEIGRVEWNTQVEIGVGAGTCAPVIEGCVFGAGKGLETHGYAALVRGNSTVTIGGYAKIGKNVYGGGEIATVGRYWVKGIHPTTICTDEAEPTGAEVPDVPDGEPYKMRRGGICSVNIQGNVDIGYHGVASDAGHVFGAGRGVNPEITEYQYHESGNNRSKRMVTYDSEKHTGVEGDTWNYTDDTHAYVWEYFTDENAYKQFLETLALVSRSTVAINGCNIKGNVYGGSESGFVQTWTSVTIQGNSKIGTSGSTTYGNVFGGGKGLATFAEAGKVRGYTKVNISDGIVYGNVYGGGERGYVQQDVTVKVSGGQVVNDVYGGGALANTNTANWDFTTPTSIYLEMSNLTFPSYSEKTTVKTGDVVTGLYTYNGSTYTLIPETDPETTAVGETKYYERHPGSSVSGLYTKSGDVYSAAAGEADGGTTYYEKRDLPGTWAAGKSSTNNTTKVILIGGIVGNVYGGGLGNPTHPVYVCGDVLVSVNDPDSIGENTGVAFTSRTKNDVTITGDENYHIVPLTGRVFGCNNINGTPLGDVNVKVFSTRTIGDNGNVIPHEDASSHTSYEIQAVYGGGNQANYVPASGKGTHVLIDGCNETTIKKVYGGGSSASVPATDVLIKAALDIGFAFGGGNGGEKVYDYVHEIWKNNDGASVNGLSKITCQGGKIGQVFGGSDNKGNCRSTSVTKSESGSCPLVITRMYGAGNEADVTGDVNIVVSGCTAGTSKIEYICGGSYNAHITGNVTLTITSGFFNSVYGGNEATGSIGGNITVNIEETDDCKPIIIGNLVGGGNMAPYPGSLSNGDPITKSGNITVNVKSATRIDNIFGGGYESEVLGNTVVNINMIKGYWAGKIYPTTVSDGHGGQITNTNENDRIPNTLGIIGNVYGGGNAGRVRGNTTVNIGTATNVQIMKRNASGKLVDSSDQEIYDASGNFNAGKSIASIVMVDKPVLGANIIGSVFGGGNEANVTGNTTVNICTANYSGVTGFEGISIDKDANGKGGTIYGGGNQGDVLGNTNVTMSGGYVFNGVFGGGYAGSVGTFTPSKDAAHTNVYGHTSHDGCIGKPISCAANTGKCTVVVNGGQIGPIEVATKGMNRPDNEGGPVPQGWVWGGGCGLVEDPSTNPDTHFKTYVGSTDVTIGGTAFIMESVIGGGEFGRVLGNTLVKIQDNCQIGVGAGMVVDGKPVRYADADFIDPSTATAAEIEAAAAKMPECSFFPYGYTHDGKTEYLPYDPYHKKYPSYVSANPDLGPASTENPSDGKSWIGCVFGGGSGYMPYIKADGSGYDWCRSAGLVEGNTTVQISGGHILTNVYGANEYTDVKDTATVTMTGGTIGVPRTLEQIENHPQSCYLFGGGKGDQRSHFNQWTDVGNVVVDVSGGIIYGSVFGGAEDGHVLGDASVTIRKGDNFTIGSTTYTNGPIIGTWGSSYVDGNIFGGGRGFSGETLTAGNVGGNINVTITGGTMLGSIYGGGRLGSVGYDLATCEMQEGDSHGHITVDISDDTGKTMIGNKYESQYMTSSVNTSGLTEEQILAARKNELLTTYHVTASDFSYNGTRYTINHTRGGCVYGGGMGRRELLDGTKNTVVDWTKLGNAKSTKVNIHGTKIWIKGSVFGGGEFGAVTGSHTSADSKTVGTEVVIDSATIGSVIGSTNNTNNASLDTDNRGTLGSGNDRYTYGGAYAGGYGTEEDATLSTPISDMKIFGALVSSNASIKLLSGDVRSSVYGGGKVACVGGDTYVTVSGGTVGVNEVRSDTKYVLFGGMRMGNVYGGGRGSVNSVVAGLVKGNTNVNISNGGIYHNVYGGGALGSVGDFDLSTDENKTSYGVMYANVPVNWKGETGTARVSITGGTIGINGHDNGMVNGSSRGDISTNKPASTAVSDPYDHVAWVKNAVVTIGNAGQGFDAPQPQIKGSVYGGGENGHNYGNAEVYIHSGTIGVVDTNEDTWSNRGSIYGAGCGTDTYEKNSDGAAFGDSYNHYNPMGGRVLGNTTVSIDGGHIIRSVYGAGSMGSASGNATVTISGGRIGTNGERNTDGITNGDVFGGPKGSLKTDPNDTHAEAHVESTTVTINYTTTPASDNGSTTHVIAGSVYGGGEAGLARGSVTVNMNGGLVMKNLYGGGALANTNTNNWNASTSNWATDNTSATNTTTVNLRGGHIMHEAYGGALGQFEKAAVGLPSDPGYKPAETAIEPKVYGDILVELNKDAAIAAQSDNYQKGCIVNKVFGCNDMQGTPKGHVTVHVYATQNSNNAKETIKDKFATRPVWKEGTGNETETFVAYLKRLIDATTAAGIPSSSNITGASTTYDTYKEATTFSKGDSLAINTAIANVQQEFHVLYDVQAVYGGGDLAPYEPVDAYSANEATKVNARCEVIIDGCDLTSIYQVYGGGNAASTPATRVRVNEAYEIEEVFGGGNGKDNYNVDEGGASPVWYDNPGANVGYKNYSHYDKGGDHGDGSDETHRYEAIINANAKDKDQRQDPANGYVYGSGTATTQVVGGRIHKVYGGSNEKGNISRMAVSVYQESEVCPLKVDETYGAGKNAEIDGDVSLTLDCVRDVSVIYGGATNADLNSGVTLTITNGTFDKVFGGNNKSGAINGPITVNIQENGCQPIRIKELYACGYLAPYSIYGYQKDNEGKYVTVDDVDEEGNTIKRRIPLKKEDTGITGYRTTAYRDPIVNVISATWIGDIFGGGYKALVVGSPHVNVNMEKGHILSKYVDPATFVGEHQEDEKFYYYGESIISEEGPTQNNGVLSIGTIDNIFGGGNQANVIGDTYVDIGTGKGYDLDGTTNNNLTRNAAIITSDVFGGGNNGDVTGNTYVNMGNGYVGNRIFGGGNHGNVGDITGRITPDDHSSHEGCIQKPDTWAENTGKCTVNISGGRVGKFEVYNDDTNHQRVVRPLEQSMTKVGGPDDTGYVFGASRGDVTDPTVAPDIHFKAYVYDTEVNISDSALIYGGVYGGSENGRVRHNTVVNIQDGQIGIGEGMTEAFNAGTRTTEYYTDAEFIDPKTTLVKDDNKLAECSHLTYGRDFDGDGKLDYLPYDAVNATPGGSTIGSDGHTFYGNVFGGGSGYWTYAKAGGGYEWLSTAGEVEGDTYVNITGGHILTNVYGGNEMTNVKGTCYITMTDGTLGVPRTLTQIEAHPVTCYLFGGGKGDQRVHFNKQTNVGNTMVNVSGGIIYGSVLGGGEDGHVMGNATMTIGTDEHTGPTIGTWGSSGLDGNVFGGGRGFAGDAYTAGNVAGSVTLNIKGGTMLGSVYGGGRLASVGYGLYDAGDDEYGEMRADNDTETGFNEAEDFPKGRGHVDINITGGTIGNNYEFVMPATIPANAAAWTTWKTDNHVPNTTYDTSNGRLIHTKGGNVYAGGMGRYTKLDGSTPISTYNTDSTLATGCIDWSKLGNVKSTKLTISGADTWIMGNVYGGGEIGTVTGSHTTADKTYGSEVSVTDATIGVEISESIAPQKDPIPVPEGYPDSGGNSDVKYTFGSVYGGGMGMDIHDGSKNENHGGAVNDSVKVTISGSAKVRASVYGAGEMALVGGSTFVTINGGEIGRAEVRSKTDTNPGYVMFGGATMGNVYGGGKGSVGHYHAGQVKGNTNITINNGSIYHMVYGGGALASVGTFKLSDGAGHPPYMPIAGIPYVWENGTGTANVTIKGGTIGISGRDNGLVFGSSRGDISKPVGSPIPIDPYLRVAWVNKTVVNIGTEGSGTDYTTPIIKGSVYGGGENGHNYSNATVNINSGTIGISDKIPGTSDNDPWWNFNDNDSINKAVRDNRGNVYGAGSGSDTYTGDDGKKHYNPKTGMVGGNTFVNIKGGHIGRSVYGAGAMASVGNITNGADTIITLSNYAARGKTIDHVAKHDDNANSFALSWPYKFVFAPNTGKTTINVTGGHIGTKDVDGGDVFGGARGEAGDHYTTSHLAYVYETEVNIDYPETPAASVIPTINEDFSKQCVTGAVSGSGEDGYVYGDTHVTLNEGLVGHSLYGAGKGKGTYKQRLLKIGAAENSTNPNDYYEADIYSLIAGKVFGNTYVTMNGGYVGRNVYGGGNMASVGKGNYAGGADDYSTAGYGETTTDNLWDNDSEDSKAFLSSGKTTVKVFGGTVGYVAADPKNSIKNNLPYGNVFGGSAGEAAPNISNSPRYHYCPAFFSGYVNATDVNIGGYECKTAFTHNAKNYAVGDRMTYGELQTALAGSSYFVNGKPSTDYWKVIGPTKIYSSVYGGGQDGHVRRDAHVTVVAGEIGLAYNTDNQSLLKTTNLDDDQWLQRGNVYGAGSGISKYEYDLNYNERHTKNKDDDETVEENIEVVDYTNPSTGSISKMKEIDYSTSAGSVTRFTQVDILGGTIHRNVYGGGSLASVGAPKIGQGYDLYKKDLNNPTTLGKQSMNIVNIRGTIGTPEDYQVFYGGEVYGASRGLTSLNANQFSTSIWTQVNILKGAKIMGSVFGGGDSGLVKKDADVIVGGE